MMWYWGYGMHWWGWLLGFIMMVGFWALVIWLVWYFVTNLTHRSEREPRRGEAKRILDERLARGEIDPDEYRRLRDLLESDSRAGIESRSSQRRVA